MKQFFEEPAIFVERFTVTDQTLTTSSVNWITGDNSDDELNKAFGIAPIT